MQHNSQFQQVVNTTNLLVRAVDRLQQSSGDSGNLPGTSQQHSPQHVLTSGPGTSQPLTVPPRIGGLTQQPLQQPLHAHVSNELSSLFGWGRKRAVSVKAGGSKKKKLQTWTHTFYCLGDPDTVDVPDINKRAALQLSGLGEKRFAVFKFAVATELHDVLVLQFPPLAHAGGYEFLRCDSGGNGKLIVIESPAGGYTAEYLKGVVGGAKLYIRPLQKNISGEMKAKELPENLVSKGTGQEYKKRRECPTPSIARRIGIYVHGKSHARNANYRRPFPNVL